MIKKRTLWALLIIALLLTPGILFTSLSVSAQRGNSVNLGEFSRVLILQPDPADPASTTPFPTIYTEFATPPSTLPLEARAELLVVAVPDKDDNIPTVTSAFVDFGLDGTVFANNTWSGGAGLVRGDGPTIQSNFAIEEYSTIFDLGEAVGFQGVGSLMAPVPIVLRAFGIVNVSFMYSGYRGGSRDGFDSSEEFTVTVNIEAVDTVDEDGNGTPDADQLCSLSDGQILFEGPDGPNFVSAWTDLDIPLPFSPGVTKQYLTGTGLVEVSVFGENFDRLQVTAAQDGSFAQQSEVANAVCSRLMMSIAGEPMMLVDGPAGVNPLDQFFLDPDPLSNDSIYVLFNILVQQPCTGVGCIGEWVALETLPAGYVATIGYAGVGITDVLFPGSTVLFYSYATDFEHVLEDEMMPGSFGPTLRDDALFGGLWERVDDSLISFGNAPNRVTVPVGATSIGARLLLGSTIIGTNFAPSLGGSSGTTGPGGDEGDTGGTGGGGGGGGGCFIATAAYGTPLADDLEVLRGIRDGRLLTNAAGSAFVDTYYRLSPSIADAIAESAVLRVLVRAVLAPIVLMSTLWSGAIFVLLVSLSLLAWQCARRAPQRRRVRIDK